jgi:hypothetical protein
MRQCQGPDTRRTCPAGRAEPGDEKLAEKIEEYSTGNTAQIEEMFHVEHSQSGKVLIRLWLREGTANFSDGQHTLGIATPKSAFIKMARLCRTPVYTGIAGASLGPASQANITVLHADGAPGVAGPKLPAASRLTRSKRGGSRPRNGISGPGSRPAGASGSELALLGGDGRK